MPNRIWLSCVGESPDWSVPNLNCSAPPPDAFPFQFETRSVEPGAQVWLLLLAKLKRLALPDRSIIALVTRTNWPSCSTALPIASLWERLKKPGLLIRLGVLESPIPQLPVILMLLAISVPPLKA